MPEPAIPAAAPHSAGRRCQFFFISGIGPNGKEVLIGTTDDVQEAGMVAGTAAEAGYQDIRIEEDELPDVLAFVPRGPEVEEDDPRPAA